MFTGDIEAAGEQALLTRTPAAALAATVLKAPHHGSRTSSSSAFVAAVRPQVVVLSLGYRNRFGFPAPEVVERYMAAGARVFRTDRSRRGKRGLQPSSRRTSNSGARVQLQGAVPRELRVDASLPAVGMFDVTAKSPFSLPPPYSRRIAGVERAADGYEYRILEDLHG